MAEDSKEASKSTEEKKSPAKEEVKASPQFSDEEIEALRQKAAVLDKIDERYLKDKNFKEVFDAGFNNKLDDLFAAKSKAFLEGNQSKKNEVDDSDPIEVLKRKHEAAQEKISKLEEKLGQIDTDYNFDKLAGNRHATNVKYEESFVTLAEKAGYEYGTKAYEALFSNVKDEAIRLAKKYGLTDNYGNPDPMAKFNPKLVEEAFGVANDRFKAMGFDIAEVRRREALENAKKARASQEDEFAISKDNPLLKTKEGRAKLLEQLVKKKMAASGFDMNDLKIV